MDGIRELVNEDLKLKWLTEIIQGVSDLPCWIGSSNSKVIEAALAVYKEKAMKNNISLDVKNKKSATIDFKNEF